jgi:hypothetical protein
MHDVLEIHNTVRLFTVVHSSTSRGTAVPVVLQLCVRRTHSCIYAVSLWGGSATKGFIIQNYHYFIEILV